MSLNLEDRLVEALAGCFPDNKSARLGVAVSGGGDSMALLDLLSSAGVAVDVVSVDHGLRTEAAAEIALVSAYCAAHGLSHETVHWHWDGHGNTQEAARDGRAELIAEWARARGLSTVALGHTLDDQAETVLMRLARGSGVDGLAAMRVVSQRHGITWLRPMLDLRRSDLRAHLRGRGIVWADDPSNEDIAYDRVKARRALEELAPLGLTPERLARTAAHMSRAREALDYCEQVLARAAVSLEGGDVVIAAQALADAPEEIRTRLVARALSWVSGNDYRPRFLSLQQAMAADQTCALHGCLMIRARGKLRITREWGAVKDMACLTTEVWDGRWKLVGPHEKALEIRALGELGLRQCEGWRETGTPRMSLLSSPSVWRGDVLIAAPLAGLSGGWVAQILPERSKFLGLTGS